MEFNNENTRLIISIVSKKDYISTLITELIWLIIINLTGKDILTLGTISRFFNLCINKIIPPKIKISKFISSVRIIDYLEKANEYTSSYNKINFFPQKNLQVTIPGYMEYEINLDELKKISKGLYYSPYFYHNNGKQKINKLCGYNVKNNKCQLKIFCSSCFRDPYLLLLVISIMILLTAILSYFLYTKTVFNINEKDRSENIMFQNEIEKNINNIQKNGYWDNTLSINSIFFERKSFLDVIRCACNDKSRMDYRYNNCKGIWHTQQCSQINYDVTGICFKSIDELCSLYNSSTFSSKYFENIYKYFNGTFCINDIQKVFMKISEYGCNRHYWTHGYDMYRTIVYIKNHTNTHIDTFTLKRVEDDNNCIGINNETFNGSFDYKNPLYIFQMSKVTYDATCIAKCVTPLPDLHENIWYLILILFLLWIIFMISLCCILN